MVNHRSPIIIIVAAGTGSRFGSSVPKQFLPLSGRPILLYSIEAFREVYPECRVVVVLSEDGYEYLESMVDVPRVEKVLGGDSRTASVRNALDYLVAGGLKSDDIVMIHDGARPLVTADLIRRVAIEASLKGASLPGFTPTDSITDENGTPIDRNHLRAVQTPQAFSAQLLVKAYSEQADAVSDDATAVFLATGVRPSIVPGDRSNIKITNPGDIEIAEIYLRQRQP